MKFSYIKYTSIYLVPLVVFISLYWGGLGSYTALVVLFMFIPFLELFTTGSTKNLEAAEEEMMKNDKVYDFFLYSLVPIQYLLMIYFLYQIHSNDFPLYVNIGMTIAFGLSCGILGINAAHELGHRITKYEQFMSKMLLLTSQYMHFYIEHNRGHHKNVSTDEDPASSRYGESIYAFYFRSIKDGWFSAWEIESKKLQKKNLSFWSLNNEMLQYQVVQFGLLLSIYLVFDFKTLMYYFTAACIGFVLLESVNYIEHYGLRRKKKGDTYEKTLPIHSWNSNHPIGRMVLLELSRHSDHHYMASRKYQLLRHHEESPQMPTGYPGMVILSLIPPLWFKIMHKKIEAYKQSLSGLALN